MAQSLPKFDFTQAKEVEGWQPTHDVARIQHTPEGMVIEIGGDDPYIHGPARDYPPGRTLWMRVRLKSDQAGTAQVFYFTAQKGTNEPDSVKFSVRAGVWEEARVPMPALGPGTRLRFDPPGTKGRCVVASIAFEPRVLLKPPAWPKPDAPTLRDPKPVIQSGDLQLVVHAPDRWGGFALLVAGQQVAVGNNRPVIGYVWDDGVRWIGLNDGLKTEFETRKGSVVFRAVITDEDLGGWALTQRFSPSRTPGAIDVVTEINVTQDRSVVFLPMLVLLPGAGTFGETKGQAVFAGLEYLDKEKEEVSSSELDIRGPGSQRQVPDTLKITFPLMAIQAGDGYLGLIWEKDPQFGALFDSPDRQFKAGGHLMGVIFPGSDGLNRVEGHLLPYDGALLKANQTLTLRATIIGGKGRSIVPAVQKYVELRGLPDVPQVGDVQDYVSLAAGGWLDSRIREGATYRHAYWPGISSFPPQPAADAAYFMEWLARQTTDKALATRLTDAAEQALAPVNPRDYDAAGVSHVRYPVASLLYGHVAENAQRAEEQARGLLGRFEPDGSVLYRKSPGRPDFGEGHFAPDANGLTAQVVQSLLEMATFCGDPELIQEGLRKLRALDKFANTVPRGAQTWEVPLHTPDILASAHLVRAYTLGYELTGEKHFLDQALYWAWTGVPFVYLTPPTQHPVGLYATTPVYGATHWVAPNWMGLPVQWCGLVYADALYRLIRHDPNGPWKRLADGITASGIQQTFPSSEKDLQGLLPDSYGLRAETRNPVAINPGTVQANAVRLFNRPEIYDFRVFRANGLFVHAPGALTNVKEETGAVSFTVEGWADRPYYVLVAGLKSAPRVRVNGRETPPANPHQYVERKGQLILRLEGKPKVEIRTR